MKKKNKTGIVVSAPRRRIFTEHEEPTASKVKRFFRIMPLHTYSILYGTVLSYFTTINQKVGPTLSIWTMKCETFQHVDFMIKVFKWIVFPTSVLYFFSDFYFFGENALDSMLMGISVFFYSNFLPDLPPICRRKIYDDIRDVPGDLSWYKKYVLLLFAPLFIAGSFCGIRLGWKTTETFHNYKSLMIYGAFLLVLSIFAFGSVFVSIGDIIEILSLPFYGLTGYLAHLRVDLCL